MWAPLYPHDLIASPKDAINVFDFEPVARKNVPPAHFGYMASGIDDEVTLRANREGFLKFQLRPRRLVDVSKVDMSIELFGATWASPIVIAPTGGNKAQHPDGEIAVARAARAGNHLQILSTSASTSVEDANRGPRRADLVPALRVTELGRRPGAGEAGRERGMPGGGGDGRSHGRQEPGNVLPAPSHR